MSHGSIRTPIGRARAHHAHAPRDDAKTRFQIRRIKLPPTLLHVERASQLRSILARQHTACIWRRRLPPALLSWLAIVAQSRREEAHLEVTFDHGELVALFGHLPASREKDAWRADIERLVRLFARLSGAASVRASLALFGTDKCRKFHADHRPLRLVCTYVGPGTECVDDAWIDRSALGKPDPSIELANARIVRRPGLVQRALTGDVVLLKGERHPENEGRGAVHRSPPIAHVGLRRLVLTLDEAGVPRG